jgi:DNA-binding NtrC family response regulator
MSTAQHKLLVVEDQPRLRAELRMFLERQGFEVIEAESCAQAKALLTAQRAQPDAALLDYELEDGTALDLLPFIKELDPSLPVVVMTGFGTIERAVKAVKEGADHFLTKPVELPTLLVLLQRTIDNRRARQRQLANAVTQRAHTEADPFLGTSDAIQALRRQAVRVASADSPILIQGETGAGKGVLARWLHNNSPRHPEALVDLNCAGLTRELLESELFGHEKGAFTGAVASKQGLLEVGHRGTVFLDEIGDIDPIVQPRLLKALEDKRIRRLGSVKDRAVDIRLIAATHKDLGELVRQGVFRGDLYFRINTIPLRVPPLRERPEDIPLLAEQLLRVIAPHLPITLSPQAVSALTRYPWPGNVRELRNVLDRALLLRDGDHLQPSDFLFDRVRLPGADPSPTASSPVSDAPSLDMSLADVERWHIERVLAAEGGKVTEAAKRLMIPRSSLYQKLKRWGVSGGDG